MKVASLFAASVVAFASCVAATAEPLETKTKAAQKFFSRWNVSGSELAFFFEHELVKDAQDPFDADLTKDFEDKFEKYQAKYEKERKAQEIERLKTPEVVVKDGPNRVQVITDVINENFDKLTIIFPGIEEETLVRLAADAPKCRAIFNYLSKGSEIDVDVIADIVHKEPCRAASRITFQDMLGFGPVTCTEFTSAMRDALSVYLKVTQPAPKNEVPVPTIEADESKGKSAVKASKNATTSNATTNNAPTSNATTNSATTKNATTNNAASKNAATNNAATNNAATNNADDSEDISEVEEVESKFSIFLFYGSIALAVVAVAVAGFFLFRFLRNSEEGEEQFV